MSTSNVKIDFPQLLREQGMKVTAARLGLLQVLSRAKKPLAAQDISAKIGSGVDPVTVYRTLKSLVESEVVRQIDFHQGRALFELIREDDHHHAVCTQCERVVDIPDACTQTMDTAALRKSGFSRITRHSLEFFGICKQCS